MSTFSLFLLIWFYCSVVSVQGELDSSVEPRKFSDMTRNNLAKNNDLRMELTEIRARLKNLEEALPKQLPNRPKELPDQYIGSLVRESREQTKTSYALISGARHHVSDEALTASSMYANRKDCGPQCSRMGVPDHAGCIGAWAADLRQTVWWIQVDLGDVFRIDSVATQGRPGYNQYVAAYKLASNDEKLVYYLNGKVFAANSDMRTVVKHSLNPTMKARRVRLYVLSYNVHASLRWELYGYQCTC